MIDEDGHRILDLWQGHMANIIGHNPEIVTAQLSRAFADGFGTQSGLVDALQVELAELVCRLTSSERVRFTTSGSLSTMYSVLMARSFTGRSTVMKAGGGWHGAQPMLLKGVAYRDDGVGFSGVDSKGLPSALTESIVVTSYNDPQHLADDFDRVGDELACLILEPMLGAGGTIAATTEYLRLARELCTKHGALLILDEMITGFRFHAGGLGALHGVTPDLAIYGKALGGGMPVAAVVGRADVMTEIARATGPRVAFSGGTYSAHPASMLAAKVFLDHLAEHSNPRSILGSAPWRSHASRLRDVLRRGRHPRPLHRRSGRARLRQLDDHAALSHTTRPSNSRRPRRSSTPPRAMSRCGRRCSAWPFSSKTSTSSWPTAPRPTTHTDDDVAFLGEACRQAQQRASRDTGEVQRDGSFEV